MGIDLITPPYYGSADLNYYGLQVNGNMEVSQEYGTTPPAASGGTRYFMDELAYVVSSPVPIQVSGAQVTDAPTGYRYSAQLVVALAAPSPTTDTMGFRHYIEGYRVARLHFGQADAIPVSIAFWVKSTLTGTFSLCLANVNLDRSYVTLLTIDTANTWEYKTVTIPGCTDGIWNIETGVGLQVYLGFCQGPTAGTTTTTLNAWHVANARGHASQTNFAATVGNTVQLTGLLVLPGTSIPTRQSAPYVARPFDEELFLCQRYWEKSYNYNVLPGTIQAAGPASTVTHWTNAYHTIQFKVRKRITPSAVTIYNWNTGTTGQIYNASTGGSATSTTGSIGERGYSQNAAVTTAQLYMWHWVAYARL